MRAGAGPLRSEDIRKPQSNEVEAGKNARTEEHCPASSTRTHGGGGTRRYPAPSSPPCLALPALRCWGRPWVLIPSQAGCETLIAVDTRPAGVFTPQQAGVGCRALPAELRAQPVLLHPPWHLLELFLCSASAGLFPAQTSPKLSLPRGDFLLLLWQHGVPHSPRRKKPSPAL